jgi:hypothetical protein
LFVCMRNNSGPESYDSSHRSHRAFGIALSTKHISPYVTIPCELEFLVSQYGTWKLPFGNTPSPNFASLWKQKETKLLTIMHASYSGEPLRDLFGTLKVHTFIFSSGHSLQPQLALL